MRNEILKIAQDGDVDLLKRDLRVRALWSPYFLAKSILGYTKLVDHFHLHDSELFMDRWANGQSQQWIEWARAFYKSTLFTISTSIWVVCPVTEEDTQYAVDVLGIAEADWQHRVKLHDQDATQLLAFETMDNARKKVGEIKWHFEENTLFRALFPEIAYQGLEEPWSADCLKIRRASYGRRLQEGTFEAIGAGGALQSRHYKLMWLDDIIGEKAMKSDVVLGDIIGWYGKLHGAFQNAARKICFGVSNRWGYNDLNSHVRANDPDVVFYTRSAWEEVDGELRAVFPEEYSIQALLKIKSQMRPYDFASQYLNRPTIAGEKEVDADRIHKYTVSADGRILCNCGAKFHPSQLLRYVHYDPYTAKDSRSTSRPAVAAVGTSTDHHVFLLAYYIAKESYNKVFDKIIQFNDRWRPSRLTYEDAGAQNMTEFYLKQLEKTAEFRDAQPPHVRLPRIQAISTHSKAKEIRIRDYLLPVFEKGKFSCQETHQHFLESCETFPFKVPGHDYDLFDCLAQGAQVWRFPVDEDTKDKSAEEEAAYLAKFGEPYSCMETRQ